MDDAPEHDVRVELAEGRGGGPERHGLEPVALVAQPGDRLGRDVGRRRQQAGVGELALAGRVEDANLDRPDRPDATVVGGDRQALDDRGVVQLHVADLEPRPLIGRQAGRDRVRLAERPGKGLLGEDGHAPVETCRDRVAVRAGGQDHQGVDVGRRQERIERGEAGGRCDPVALTDDLDEARRQVRDRRDLEAVGEPVEERQVDGLGHRTESEDADSDAIRHSERCS